MGMNPTLEYYIQTKFYGNMHQTLKSPRCRQPNAYKNVTVVPLEFGNASAPQTIEARSPRSNSKTKLKLVSPMRKLNQTAFLSKTNQPTYTNQLQKTMVSPKNSVRIQLGGRSSSKNKENTIQPRATLSKINNHSYLQSSQKSVSIKQGPAFIQTQPIHQSPLQSRISSPSKSIHITYKPSPAFICRQSPALTEKVQPITIMHVRRSSFGMNIPETNSNFPTELQIREENVIQELKESYECELKEIKKLKQEIEKNNYEIKKLLKTSRASKETTKSKTLIDDPTTQRQPELNGQFQIKILTNEQQRSLVYHQQNSHRSFDHDQKEYERKENAICSKKTLINDLDFQPHQKHEDCIQMGNNVHYTEGVQTQEAMIAPILKEQSSNSSKSSLRQPKLTLNNVCQVQFVLLKKDNVVDQPIDLEDSIICQKEDVMKLPTKQTSSQTQQIDVKLDNSAIIENLSQLKKESEKMIGEIKSLTKAVYESEVKEKKVPTIDQITMSVVKAQIEAMEANILPVSQNIINLQPANSETWSKGSRTKVLQSSQLKKVVVQPPRYEAEMQISVKKSVSPKKSVEIKPQTGNQASKTTINDGKKHGRKINNSIYL